MKHKLLLQTIGVYMIRLLVIAALLGLLCSCGHPDGSITHVETPPPVPTPLPASHQPEPVIVKCTLKRNEKHEKVIICIDSNGKVISYERKDNDHDDR